MSDPWMKFYPRDWRGDQALRAVSLAARGLWMECLCIMHEAKPYGHLVLNGSPVDDGTLARMTGASVDEVSALMAELRQAGVLSVTGKGAIVSRRMIKDEARAKKGRKAVEKRWAQASETSTENDGPNRSPIREPITQKPDTRYQKTEITPARQETEAPPEQGRARDLFEELWGAYPPNPYSSRKSARKHFDNLSELDQVRVLAAAQRFQRWFHLDNVERGRSDDDGLRFTKTLESWLSEDRWKDAEKLPLPEDRTGPVVPHRRIDRYQQPELWAELERLRGKKAPTSDGVWSFPVELIDKATANLQASEEAA